MWTPLFGLYLARAGLIAVDRRGGARALKRMVAAARKAARLGRPIVIFPAGTRVAPDQHRTYQPGVAALYGPPGLPVVPVAPKIGRESRREIVCRSVLFSEVAVPLKTKKQQKQK